jgi:hypothetical protein
MSGWFFTPQAEIPTKTGLRHGTPGALRAIASGRLPWAAALVSLDWLRFDLGDRRHQVCSFGDAVYRNTTRFVSYFGSFLGTASPSNSFLASADFASSSPKSFLSSITARKTKA